MTLEEFNRDIDTVSALLDFCWENDCDIGSEIYDADGRDDYINQYQISDNSDTWQELLRFLEDIPTGYEWYYVSDYGEWYGFDDNDPEFFEYKDRVREWAVDNDVFESDEEDEEEEEEEPTCAEYGVTDPEAIEDEVDGPSLFQLCHESSVTLQKIRIASEEAARKRAEEEAADDAEFTRLLTMTMAV